MPDLSGVEQGASDWEACLQKYGALGTVICPGLVVGGAAIGALPGGGAIKAASGALNDVSAGLVLLANPQNWLRVGEALAGAVLILVGILVLVWHTPAAQEAKEVAGPLAGAAAAVAA